MARLAALSGGLLARKGQAKPAMRPQGYAGYSAPVEDLGWNDMDGGEPVSAPVPVVAPVVAPAPTPLPPVLVGRAELSERLSDRRSVSAATAARIRRETEADHAKGRKAAFTLRLDVERHLRLRLASAIDGRSSQMLMTDALDAFLATVPDVEGLVAQLPPARRALKGSQRKGNGA